MDRHDAPGCTRWTPAELVCISLKETNMKTTSRRKNTKLRVVPEASVETVSPVKIVEIVETAAAEIFEGALDVDSREFAKLGDALRAVQLQLGRASLVRDGHMPSVDNADQRERRGAEILSAMTGGTCTVEGVLTLVRLFDYHGLRARQLARRSRPAA
jgi:hypothetical protein